LAFSRVAGEYAQSLVSSAFAPLAALLGESAVFGIRALPGARNALVHIAANDLLGVGCAPASQRPLGGRLTSH
jgi:hypothetical protein